MTEKAIEQMTLAEMVRDFGRVPRRGNSPLTITFTGTFKSDRVSLALSRMTMEEQAVFMRKFLDLWYGVVVNDDYGSSKTLYETVGGPKDGGPEMSLARPLLFTLTADRRQFRAWFEIPSFIGAIDVSDEHGGCLFTVTGTERDVQAPCGFVRRELNHLMPWQLHEVILESGTSLFYP